MILSSLIVLHSIFRWLLLLSLVYTIFRGFKSWYSDKKFTQTDNMLRQLTATLSHIQLLMGILLYLLSPDVSYFLNNFKTAVHISDIRFFGMEHSIMMVIAVAIITIGSIVTKRKSTEQARIKSQLIWFTTALIIIIIFIPWPFSPFGASRPYFRGF